MIFRAMLILCLALGAREQDVLPRDSASGSMEAQLSLMNELMRAGEVHAALHAGEAAVRANPDSAPLHAVLGDIYFRDGLFDLAEERYKSALALNRNSLQAWLGLGRNYSIRSMSEEAKHSFMMARELDPKAVEDWLDHLPSSVQRAAYRKYASGDDEQPGAGCEMSLENAASDPEDKRKEEVPLSAIFDDRGNVQGAGISVRMNGGPKAQLLFDTGASGITIGRRLAERAGVTKVQDWNLRGMGGSGAMEVYLGRADSIKIGHWTLRNCLVQVSPQDKIAFQDGLIGADVFAQYLVTIDFPARKLRLRNRAEIPEKQNRTDRHRANAFRFAHLLLFPASLGDASGLFVLDSGANVNTISRKLVGRTREKSNNTANAKGAAGAVRFTYSRNASLELASFNVADQSVVATDLDGVSERLGAEVAGLIGFSALKNFKITIDYKRGVAIFEQ